MTLISAEHLRNHAGWYLFARIQGCVRALVMPNLPPPK